MSLKRKEVIDSMVDILEKSSNSTANFFNCIDVKEIELPQLEAIRNLLEKTLQKNEISDAETFALRNEDGEFLQEINTLTNL